MSLFLTAFVSALLFGIGLSFSGMTLPAKVIGFLDVAGDWDPSLLAVMAGAILVHAVSYRVVAKRRSPVLTTKFHIPTRRDIDWKLVLGSAIFGAGWGLGGFCPGPALVNVVTGQHATVVFVVSMIAGIYLHKIVENKFFANEGK